MDRNCLNCAFHRTDSQNISVIVCWFNPPKAFFAGFDKAGRPGTVTVLPNVHKDYVCHNHLTKEENELRYMPTPSMLLKGD